MYQGTHCGSNYSGGLGGREDTLPKVSLTSMTSLLLSTMAQHTYSYMYTDTCMYMYMYHWFRLQMELILRSWGHSVATECIHERVKTVLGC